MRRIERLMNLIIALLETSRPLTAEEIRERVAGYGDEPTHDAFRRAFERDKEALRGMGIPLEVRATDPFVDQLDGYIIPKAKYYLPELELEPDELAALRIAADAVLSAADEAASGFLKLAVEADRDPAAAPRVVRGADVAAEQPLLTPIYMAVLERQAIRFDYERTTGERSRRTLEPYALVHRKGHWYVVGRDRERDDIRSFKISRIVSVPEKADDGYEIPGDFDASAHLSGEAWEIGREDQETAVVRFDPELRWWAEQNLRPSSVREAPDGAIDVELPVANPDALISWALGFGSSVEIVSPDELRHRMLQHLGPFLEDVR